MMNMFLKKYNLIPYWDSWIWAEEQNNLQKVKRKDLLRNLFFLSFFFLSLYKESYSLTADVLEKKASPDSRSRF